MSPTLFRERGYRFFLFSREEPRMHVHVIGPNGEAKFWIDPQIELAQNQGMRQAELRVVRGLIEEHADEIWRAWQKHFGR